MPGLVYRRILMSDAIILESECLPFKTKWLIWLKGKKANLVSASRSWTLYGEPKSIKILTEKLIGI